MTELRRRNPQSGEAALGLGLLATARGRVDEARAYVADVALDEPGYAETRALAALLDGSLDDARRRELCATIRQLAGPTRRQRCALEC